jgi:hypothetical protein
VKRALDVNHGTADNQHRNEPASKRKMLVVG